MIVLSYRKILSSKELPYEDFGFNAEDIKKGNIPSSAEFEKKVVETFKKKVKEDGFDIRSFRRMVMEFYRDFRHMLHEGKPKEGVGEQLAKAKEKVVLLEKLLEEKLALLNDLKGNVPAAIKVLKDALGKAHVSIKFKEAGAGHVDLPTINHSEHMVSRSPMDILKNHLVTLEKGLKDDPDYGKAINAVRHELSRQIAEVREDLAKARQEEKMYAKRWESIGHKPETIRIKKPVTINPLGDLADLKVMMETMDFPVEETTTTKPHHYAWLYQHSYMTRFLKQLEEKVKEKSDTHYKSDIGEDVMPAITEALLKLFRLSENLGRDIVGGESSKGLTSQLSLAEHAFTVVPEELFNKFKDYLSGLKSKHTPDEFNKLTKYSLEARDFITDKSELPESMHADRDKLEKFFKGLIQMAHKNQDLFEKKWRGVLETVSRLKKKYQEFKVLYNAIAKEEYFDTWLKGGTPSWMKKKAFEIVERGARGITAAGSKYKDSERWYQNVVSDIGELRDFVKDYPIFQAKNVKEFSEEMKKIKDLNEFVTKLGNLIQKCVKAINDYYTGTEAFIHSMISGDILSKATEKTASVDIGPALVYSLRRMAYRMLVAEEKKDEKAVEWHSEYPLSMPLQKRKPTKEPPLMSKTYLDYFVKSFPVEEFLNEWFEKLSGSKTLNPDKIPALQDRIDHRIKEDLMKKYDKDKLAKDRDKLEDELNKKLEEIKALDDQIKSYGKWADKSFDKYDEAIESAKFVGEAYDKELKGKVQKIKELQKERADIRSEFEKLSAKDINKKIINKMIKRVNEIHNEHTKTLNDIQDILKESKSGVNPFTGTKEQIEQMEDKASRVWNIYNDRMVRNVNRIKDLQDEEYKLENQIANMDEWLDSPDKIPADKLDYAVRQVMSEIWHQVDAHWMRSIKEFQSRFNLNFEDYLEIKGAFEKAIKHPVSAMAIGRIIKELKSAIKFLKDKGKPVPDGYFEALSKLTKRPVKEESDYDKEEAPKEAPKEEEKSASELYDFPSQMAYNVAIKFAGYQEPVSTELEVVLS